LDQALRDAADQLGVAPDQVRYQVVAQTRGLLGFFGRQVEITASAPSRRQGASAERRSSGRRSEPMAAQRSRRQVEDAEDHEESETPRVPARVLSDEEVQALVVELRVFFAGMIERMTGEPCDVMTELEDGRLVLDADSAFLAEEIQRYPKVAEAFENVIRKKPRHLKQELPFRVFVDARSSRRGHEKELVQMAIEMSEKVVQSQRPIVLNNRSAYDRKIIHMALDRDERVLTKSIGTGPSRKLMIMPSRSDAVEH
jgi:spoIIIJ-associated protein